MKQLLPKMIYFLTIKPRLNKLKKLLPEASIYPSGSRYVCNPPVMTTDIDFLVWCEKELEVKLAKLGYRKSMVNNGYGAMVDAYPNANFLSLRKGKVNLIVTTDRKFADGWVVATHICKKYNFRWKWNRVQVYEALRGNFEPDWFPEGFDRDLIDLLASFNGYYGNTMLQAYRAQHGLV